MAAWTSQELLEVLLVPVLLAVLALVWPSWQAQRRRWRFYQLVYEELLESSPSGADAPWHEQISKQFVHQRIITEAVEANEFVLSLDARFTYQLNQLWSSHQRALRASTSRTNRWHETVADAGVTWCWSLNEICDALQQQQLWRFRRRAERGKELLLLRMRWVATVYSRYPSAKNGLATLVDEMLKNSALVDAHPAEKVRLLNWRGRIGTTTKVADMIPDARYSGKLDVLTALMTYLALTPRKSRTPRYLARDLSLPEEAVTDAFSSFPGIFRRSRETTDDGQHFYTLHARYALRSDADRKEVSGDLPELRAEILKALLDFAAQRARAEQVDSNMYAELSARSRVAWLSAFAAGGGALASAAAAVYAATAAGS